MKRLVIGVNGKQSKHICCLAEGDAAAPSTRTGSQLTSCDHVPNAEALPQINWENANTTSESPVII
jgi:hypothetical protein